MRCCYVCSDGECSSIDSVYFLAADKPGVLYTHVGRFLGTYNDVIIFLLLSRWFGDGLIINMRICLSVLSSMSLIA